MSRVYWRWPLSGDPVSILALLDDRVTPLELLGPLAEKASPLLDGETLCDEVVPRLGDVGKISRRTVEVVFSGQPNCDALYEDRGGLAVRGRGAGAALVHAYAL